MGDPTMLFFCEVCGAGIDVEIASPGELARPAHDDFRCDDCAAGRGRRGMDDADSGATRDYPRIGAIVEQTRNWVACIALERRDGSIEVYEERVAVWAQVDWLTRGEREWSVYGMVPSWNGYGLEPAEAHEGFLGYTERGLGEQDYREAAVRNIENRRREQAAREQAR